MGGFWYRRMPNHPHIDLLFSHLLFLQTLTTLDLSCNKIGPQGMEHLANALEQNKVMQIALLYSAFIYSHANF